MTVMPIFRERPEEMGVIGRMLTGYGELEVHMGLCVGVVLGDNLAGLKVVFSIMGEKKRIEAVKDAIEPECKKLDLMDEFAQAFDAMDYCRRVRNNFSHCQWAYRAGYGIFYGNLMDGAKDLKTYKLELRHIDTPLLDKLEWYQVLTRDSIAHLEHEMLFRMGRRKNNPWERLKDFEQPPMFNPANLHPAPADLKTIFD